MSKRIVILGSGESGVGAAILAKHLGYDVFVSDKGVISEQYEKELKDLGIEYESGQHTFEKIKTADIVVKSPGIADTVPLILELKSLEKEIVSEIEFGFRHTDSKIIAVTGTNGKTTTTSLIYDILKRANYNVALAGNIGKSFARQIVESPAEWYVLEISSYQLDGCQSFKPIVSVLCNITEDHLDRYDNKFENYIQSKLSITQNQSADDYFIYNEDDAVTRQYLNEVKSSVRKIPFSIHSKLKQGGYIHHNNFIIELENQEEIMSIEEFSLRGTHNTYNSMAAGIAAKLIGIRKEVIRKSLQDFSSLEHRLEYIATVNEVDYINDSKATNVNSVWFALESMYKPVILIAGGVDKGNDYSILKELVKEKVKGLICLGLDNEKLRNAFKEDVGYIVDATSAEEAVRLAADFSEPGDVVLLSPACASFDLFDSYEDRGIRFKKNVRNL